MTFYHYMMRRYRSELNSYAGEYGENPIVDLAAGIARDGDFPRNSETRLQHWHTYIRRYLSRRGAETPCIRAFEYCWREYLAELARRDAGRKEAGKA